MNISYLIVFSITLFNNCMGFFITDQSKTGIDINKIFDYGPFLPSEASYEYPILNDTELTPFSNNLTTQIRGQLFFPNTSINHTGGPFPILVFLPGKHPDCRLPTPPSYPNLDFQSADSLGHCPNNLSTVPSHLGYAYLGQYFASHGYIVSSIDVVLINNKWGIPGDSTLNFVRARLVLRTLQKMMEWNSSAEVSKQVLDGVDLSGKFDFGQVGLIGHSRGGEGVRNAYNMLMENKGPSDAPQWRERLPGVMIKGIMEIAPMYYGQNGTTLGVENIPWSMIVSGCEDDEVDYAHVYLAYRQLQTSKSPNHVIHVYGANHEYYNTEWQIGFPMCFGDQDPLWDVNASTFKVSDIYPPARNTSLDVTLLKINGSEPQRKTAIFSLALFFRAYVGVNADSSLAKFLEPSAPYVIPFVNLTHSFRRKTQVIVYSRIMLPDNFTEIGRQYFNNALSTQLFNGTGTINSTAHVQIIPLQQYARSNFDLFATAYENSSIPPPQFSFQPPKKGNLSLGCLEKVENAVHIDFGNDTKPEITVLFDKMNIKNVTSINIQLARRSSCWFGSTHPSICAEPRVMQIDIQLQTQTGYIPGTTISLKSRYNLQYARCDAMDFPPEKIGFLPVMFETIRIPVTDDVYISGLKFISQNGGSMILGDISAIVQQSSIASFLSMSAVTLYSALFMLFSFRIR